MFLDADELLTGNIDLHHLNLTPGNVYKLDIVSYPWIGDDEDTFKTSNFPYRKKSYDIQKVMIIHDKNNYNNYKISFGNHNVFILDKLRDDGVMEDILIAHFPIRSKKQFIRKNVLGWIAICVLNPNLISYTGNFCIHWRNRFNFLMSKNLNISENDLLEYLYETHDRETIIDSLIYDPIDTIETSFNLVSNDSENMLILVNWLLNSLKENEKLKRRNEKLKQKKRINKEKNIILTKEINKIKSSNSWKLTKPLRNIGKIFKH